jgi:hypothetical protein
MIVADWVMPVAVAGMVGLFGATVDWSRHTGPRDGTRLLVAMSTTAAAALWTTLAALALPLLGRSDSVADRAHWSDAVIGSRSALDLTLRVMGAIALTAVVLRVFLELRVLTHDTAAANRFRHEVGAAYGDTVVAALDQPDAIALSSGVIVITESLVRALDADERRAVLAHERAHLRHRHHRYRQAAALVAAANPLLRRVPEAVGYLTERWADEEAARVTSRATTATALARTACVTSSRLARSLARMHAGAADVPERILALETEPLGLNWRRQLPQAVLVAGALAVALMAAERTLDLFQLAHALRDVASTP